MQSACFDHVRIGGENRFEAGLILRVIVKVFKKIDAFKNKFIVVLLYRNERLCLDV